MTTTHDAYKARGFVLLAEIPSQVGRHGVPLDHLVLFVDGADVELQRVTILLPNLGCSVVAYVSDAARRRSGILTEIGEAWLAFVGRSVSAVRKVEDSE